MLKEQIKTHSTKLSTELTRINVRRRFILEDFKNARKRRVHPLSNLKITLLESLRLMTAVLKESFSVVSIYYFHSSHFLLSLIIYILVLL